MSTQLTSSDNNTNKNNNLTNSANADDNKNENKNNSDNLLLKGENEIYPDTSFSAVLDSYDYWNIIDNKTTHLHRNLA